MVLRLPSLGLFAAAVYALAGLAFAIWLWLTVLPPTLFMRIPADAIKPESGLAYLVRLQAPQPWLYRLAGDEGWGAGKGRKSWLRLYEDGREIGPGHTAQPAVRTKGNGRFIHDRNLLVFSSSDGSDPRSNQRQYSIDDYASPSIYLSWSTFFLLVAALSINFRLSRSDKQPSSYALAEISSFNPIRTPYNSRIWIGLALAVLLMGPAIVIADWDSARSLNVTYGGWLPLSDGSGWWNCAKGLEHVGAIPSYRSTDWCQWRHIYPAMAGSLSALVGGDTLWLLLAQAILVSAAAFWLLREIARLTGFAGAAFAALLIFSYASDIVLDQFGTENAGLTFGLTGLALLLSAAESRDRRALLPGIVAMSLAFAARPGALFVLPFLVLWSARGQRRWYVPAWRMLLLAALAAASGPLVQALLLRTAGGNLESSAGNFSYTLYGIVTGGRGWMSVLSDHPDLRSLSTAEVTSRIYALAWAEFVSHPRLLLQGLAVGFTRWATDVFSTAPSWAINPLRFVLVPSGLVALFRLRWSGRGQVLALIAAGELLSAPWIGTDGGPRVLAATVAIDIIVASLGLQQLVHGTVWLLGVRSGAGAADTVGPVQLGPAMMLGALVLLVTGPILHLPGLLVPAPTQPPVCQAGLDGYTFDVNRGFVIQQTPPGGRFEALAAVPANLLAAQARFANTWWAEEFPGDLADGTAIMLFASTDLGASTPFELHLIWPDAPPLHRGDRLELCVDRSAAHPDPILNWIIPVVSGRVTTAP